MPKPLQKVTAPKVLAMKAHGQKIVCLTAYDYTSGLLTDSAGADIVLVGDSLGTVIKGEATTTTVTLEEICYHVKAVRKGVDRALLVADLPLGSYGSSLGQAVESAVQLVRAGAEAVKLEGTFIEECLAISKIGIPVMGHLGMTPQSVNLFGGHRVQGKGDAAQHILKEAAALDQAGVFAIVLELVPASTARLVTNEISVPTIGIGAGPSCDGQIQVFHDLIGLWPKAFKHSKRYANGHASFLRGLRKYADEVRSGQFPSEEHSF